MNKWRKWVETDDGSGRQVGHSFVRFPSANHSIHVKHSFYSKCQQAAALGAALFGFFQAHAQTTVTVDSTRTWLGYMNVYDLESNYQFGTPWGVADLKAFFTSTNALTLAPNISIDRDNPSDPYWWVGGVTNGAPNKIMEANMYVQDDSLAGQTIVFTGTCLTNSLTAEYTSVAFIKDFTPDYSSSTISTSDLAAGQPFSLSLDSVAGHHIQYGFQTTGPDARIASAAALGQVVLAVNNADPSLGKVASQVLVEGQTARFSIAAQGTAPLAYQWSFGTAFETNALVNGGRISGSTTAHLTISNVTTADVGTYLVTVSNSKGSGTTQGSLIVRPIDQARTNILVDPSFEVPSFAITADAGWVNYNGSALKTTNDFYPNGGPNIEVLDGGSCFMAYSTGPGTYNGCFQQRPAQAGEVYAVSGWAYTPSSDPIGGTGSCALEVKFLDAAGGLLSFSRSGKISSDTPTDTWTLLQVTNLYATDYVTLLGTSPYLTAPAGTAVVQYQVTYVPDSGGSVFVDSADLQLKAPAVVVASKNGSIEISFPTLYGPTYQVLAKARLSDPTWQVIKEVVGDGTVQTVSDPLSLVSRYYIVNTK